MLVQKKKKSAIKPKIVMKPKEEPVVEVKKHEKPATKEESAAKSEDKTVDKST